MSNFEAELASTEELLSAFATLRALKICFSKEEFLKLFREHEFLFENTVLAIVKPKENNMFILAIKCPIILYEKEKATLETFYLLTAVFPEELINALEEVKKFLALKFV